MAEVEQRHRDEAVEWTLADDGEPWTSEVIAMEGRTDLPQMADMTSAQVTAAYAMGLAKGEGDRGELLELLEQAVAIHDKWFGTYGDHVRAGELVDDVRVVLQAHGRQAAFSDFLAKYTRKGGLFENGKRVNGEPLAEGDWRPGTP